jgi:hypothetical protein
LTTEGKYEQWVFDLLEALENEIPERNIGGSLVLAPRNSREFDSPRKNAQNQ